MAKLFHYLLEMKKELDLLNKQRREKQLETQRLREKCQQLEDSLAAEQARTQQQSERAERAQQTQRKMAAQLEEKNVLIAAQATRIEQLQSELAASQAELIAGATKGESIPDLT